MKKFFSFAIVMLLTRTSIAQNRTAKCERAGQEQDISSTIVADNVPQKIRSTKDYLEFNNKKIEKLCVPSVKDKKPSVDTFGNIYFQQGEKLFISKRTYNGMTYEVAGITLLANRTNEIFIDSIYSYVFIGTHNGLFAMRAGGFRAVLVWLTKDIIVDFGIVDSKGSIYFGTDGSNTERSERLFVLQRPSNLLIPIKGIETTLGSYPIESRDNRNKIAIDSKNNVYVGAYSSYVYLIKSGDIEATKIKDNRDNGGVTAIVVDGKDNIYCRTYTELNVYENGTFVKILETIDFFDLFISIDDNDDVHFHIAGEEYALRKQEISAFEVTGLSSDRRIILTKNLMVRNNIFYFTTRGNGTETICAIKPGDPKIVDIYTLPEYQSIAIDRQNNIYMTAESSTIAKKIVPYVLRANAQMPMPIEIRGVASRRIYRAYTDNRDNTYFSSSNGIHVLNFDEVVPHRLRATASNVSSVVVSKNDNIYFGTYYDGAFVLKAGEKEATKIDGIAAENGQSSTVETFVDKNSGTVYFQTSNGRLYRLMSGETVVSKIVDAGGFQFYLSDCDNNTYYVSGNEILLLKSGESIPRKIATISGQVLSIEADSSNRIYFATTIGLQVLSAGGTSLLSNVFVNSLAIDREDNVYFGTANGTYVFQAASGMVQPIFGINESVAQIVVNGYEVYFITNMGSRLFMLQNKLSLNSLFANRSLGEIDDNEEETILNTLNFLNIGNDYLLNLSKNRVVNRTKTSAIVVGIRGKYFGHFNVDYAIINRVEKDFTYFVDVDFLKKSIFFNYINDNLFSHRKTNDIRSIELNIENLRFSVVQVLKDSDLNSSVDFRNVCEMKKVANPSLVDQVFKFPECNYNAKENVTFHITSGINKPFYDLSQPFFTPNDEAVITNYLYETPSESDELNGPIPLSAQFELANNNSFTRQMVVYNFSEPEQDIVVPPKQQISVKYSVRTFTNSVALKLMQKIHGVIISKVTDSTEEQTVQITLRTAMQVLEKYSQLPVEVKINDDNSITFVGKGILISNRESVPMVIRNFS